MPEIGITLAGVALPDEAAVLSRTVEHRDRSRRVILEQGDGSVAVLERWTGVELVVSCVGFFPPALRAISRSALVSLTYPDLEAPLDADRLRTVQGLVTALSWSDELGPEPVSAPWSITLRELSSLATLPVLSVGGVTVPDAAQADQVQIRRAYRTAGTLLELSDGSAVPQLAWRKAAYTLSGQGWVPPGLIGLTWGATITLVSAEYGTVDCWISGDVEETQQRTPEGPVWRWSVTLREQ
jgi:hypothetical protein